MRAIASALVVALMSPIAPAPALAQPQPKPMTDAQVTQAKDLVNKAIAKSQAGDHAAAIDLYLQAYNIAPLPLLLSNLGSEYQQTSKPIEALKYFCKYLEAEPTGPNSGYATAQAKVLQTQLHNPVDDANVCKPLAVPHDTHEPPPPPPPPPPDPNLGSDATAGSASARPSPPSPPSPPADPGHKLKLYGAIIGGSGVVLALLGGAAGLDALSISNSITNHNVADPWPSNIDQQEHDGQLAQDAQIGLLVVGGAAIATGVVMYALGRKKTSSVTERIAVVPTASPSFTGLSFVGGW